MTVCKIGPWNDDRTNVCAGEIYRAEIARRVLIDFLQKHPWAEKTYHIAIHKDMQKRSCIELSDEMTQYLIQHCQEKYRREMMEDNHVER
tara:strand:+ start:827 stop:1096 length:270 start_codon:yes stop_codon:yes gene_type:complete